MFDAISEFDSAVMTAENHGDAYRMVDFTGVDNENARTELLTLLIKFHPRLTNEEMVTVANQVIAEWIADYHS